MTLLLALLLAAGARPTALPGPQPGPALAARLATGADQPEYPLGPGRVPDFNAPGDPFTLSDLRFHLSDTFRTSQSFAARVRYKDLGYLGAEFDGERRGLSLTTHRLAVSAYSDDGSWDLGADFRARRFVLSSAARSLGGSSAGALLEQALAVRVTRDLEAQAWVVGDTGRPDDRLLREAAVGLFWQRAAGLEASGEFIRTYESTEAGENRRDGGYASLLAQLGPAELSAGGSIEETSGRFPRREGDAHGEARVTLAPRLLLEAGARGRFEAGAGTRLHEYRGRVSWLARRYRLPRAGELGRRAVALAGRASDAGEYELRAFDENAIRAQRERLSLSPGREALREDMDALYRAQVAERLVPLLGASFLEREDAFAGEHTVAAGVFAGVPWPPAWPWRASEGSVPFLLLTLEREQRTTATSFRADASTARLTVALSRELDLLARFTRSEPSALDLIRGIGRRNTFELSCVYARGR